MTMHMYRGFEIFPLIYPHVRAEDGRAHNYEAGFDAAVKICLRGTDAGAARSQTFKLIDESPFACSGDARRASLRYAEAMIDEKQGEQWMLEEVL